MINWIFVKYLRGKNNVASPIQKSAQALLSSTIADGDVVTDWLYYGEIRSNQDVPEWLSYLQLVSCIFGTLSWLSVATDGRFVDLIRLGVIIFLLTPVLIAMLPLWVLGLIVEFCCFGTALDNLFARMTRWTYQNVLQSLMEQTKQKSAFSSGFLLIVGILLEDVPQLVVTFLIENKIKSDHPRGNISSAALVNLNFAIFDIFHKLAQAYDLRSDILNPGYSVMGTFRAHERYISSLLVGGANQLISTSSGEIAKLCDTTTGKCKKIFKCESSVIDAVVMDNVKVIIACGDKCIRIFNMATGKLENKLELNFKPAFVSLSPNGKSIFTAGAEHCIQSWDYPQRNKRPFTYNWSASSLDFLDNDTFVSVKYPEKRFHLGNKNNDHPIQTIKLNYETWSALAMSRTVFLITTSDWGGRIHQFVYTENEWKLNSIIHHSKTAIRSLTKVNESLFVASYKNKAKLYNLKNSSSPLFVFQGHNFKICSSVFLKEHNAVATGDDRGHIKIWSIKKYLQNDTKDIPQISSKSGEHDEDHNVDIDEV